MFVILKPEKKKQNKKRWTGSNNNPKNNAGEGTDGSDRSNIVLLDAQVMPLNVPLTKKRTSDHVNMYGDYAVNYPATQTSNLTLAGLSSSDLINIALLNSGTYIAHIYK